MPNEVSKNQTGLVSSHQAPEQLEAEGRPHDQSEPKSQTQAGQNPAANQGPPSEKKIEPQSKVQAKPAGEPSLKGSVGSSFQATPRGRKPKLAELELRFGRPPVLSSESKEHYYELLVRLLSSFGPLNAIEEILIKDVADATWDVMRCKRYKILLIEEKFRETNKREEQRARQKRKRARNSHKWWARSPRRNRSAPQKLPM